MPALPPAHRDGLCDDLRCDRCVRLHARYRLFQAEVAAAREAEELRVTHEAVLRRGIHGAAVLALLLLIGCGGSPSGPTPISPSSITVSGALTDTVTGQAIGTYVQTVNTLPALITLSHPGYHPRTARVSSASQTLDLIPERFDLAFYRQLARNGHEAPTALEPLRVLSASPSIYLQRTGLSDATVAALEQAARSVVPALTGGRLQVVAWETGEAVRAPRADWIMVDIMNDAADLCGKALRGSASGQIWLNITPKCAWGGHPIQIALLSHEIGHALGFTHVADATALMTNRSAVALPGLPSHAERAAGAVAYARARGNLDVDQDVLSSALLAPMVVD